MKFEVFSRLKTRGFFCLNCLQIELIGYVDLSDFNGMLPRPLSDISVPKGVKLLRKANNSPVMSH